MRSTDHIIELLIPLFASIQRRQKKIHVSSRYALHTFFFFETEGFFDFSIVSFYTRIFRPDKPTNVFVLI